VSILSPAEKRAWRAGQKRFWRARQI